MKKLFTLLTTSATFAGCGAMTKTKTTPIKKNKINFQDKKMKESLTQTGDKISYNSKWGTSHVFQIDPKSNGRHAIEIGGDLVANYHVDKKAWFITRAGAHLGSLDEIAIESPKKPMEAKPMEAKPMEAKPMEAKPMEAKPMEMQTVDENGNIIRANQNYRSPMTVEEQVMQLEIPILTEEDIPSAPGRNRKRVAENKNKVARKKIWVKAFGGKVSKEEDSLLNKVLNRKKYKIKQVGDEIRLVVPNTRAQLIKTNKEARNEFLKVRKDFDKLIQRIVLKPTQKIAYYSSSKKPAYKIIERKIGPIMIYSQVAKAQIEKKEYNYLNSQDFFTIQSTGLKDIDGEWEDKRHLLLSKVRANQITLESWIDKQHKLLLGYQKAKEAAIEAAKKEVETKIDIVPELAVMQRTPFIDDGDSTQLFDVEESKAPNQPEWMRLNYLNEQSWIDDQDSQRHLKNAKLAGGVSQGYIDNVNAIQEDEAKAKAESKKPPKQLTMNEKLEIEKLLKQIANFEDMLSWGPNQWVEKRIAILEARLEELQG